ncbi:MAG: Fic family protein [Clostridiales bacterium]|nr:Fic family protein [Clostridiales bacterium]
MRRYDYSFLKNSIPGNLVGMSNTVADLNAKEKFRILNNAQLFEAMRQKSVVESVKGSNAIEGVVATDERIRDIVKGSKPVTHDEKEISGYKDALNLIHTGHKELDLSAELIRRFHKMMLNDTSPVEAGRFKTRDNLIMEYSPSGERRIRFKPVGSSETEKSVEQMILAYVEARQRPDIPALFLIPCVVLDFLCIHPFTDGNGRISRLMTVLLLYIHGYDICKYISFEACTEKYKEAYYKALEKSSIGWHQNQNNYESFMVFFLQVLYRCYKDLDDNFIEISLKKASKTERIETILMNAIVPISKMQVLEKVPDTSVRTVEYVLQNLLKENKIRKIGTYKNARYIKI